MARYFWRKYHCNECGHEWDRLTAWSRNKGADPLDECPECSKQQTEAIAYQNKAPVGGVKHGNVSKAAEMTSRMLEEQYGIPRSMQVDNAREGDSYVKMPATAPKIQYMNGGAPSVTPEQAKNIINRQLSMVQADKGIGPNNVNAVDFIKGLNIPDPRKTAEFISTRD